MIHKKNTNTLIGILLLTLLSLYSFSQTKSIKSVKFENTSAKLNRDSIPKILIKFHTKEFPITTNESWYGYPEFPIDSNWFYRNTTIKKLSAPKYYMVEFTKDTILRRLIYNVAGKKVSVYKSISPKISY